MNYEQPRHSTPVKKTGNSGIGESNNATGSLSNSIGALQMSDLESSTVEKQRKELQLLIGELKDRDKELNDMVAAHQQQIAAWEKDRQRVSLLEKRCSKFEGEMRRRNEQLRLLIQRLKISESQHKSKDTALESTQSQLRELEKGMSSASYEVQELKDRNSNLNTSLSGMTERISHLESKEQELLSILRIKEQELLDASSQVSALGSKLRCLDAELRESQRSESRLSIELQEDRAKYKASRQELENLKVEIIEKTNELITYRKEVGKVKDEIHKLQRDMALYEEEIRRKDELISLQRSKQDRTDKELAALRTIYDRQQRDLNTLQINLENSQEILAKQEEKLHEIRPEDFNSKSNNKGVSLIESKTNSSSCSCKLQYQDDVITEAESVESLPRNDRTSGCVSESENRCQERSEVNTLQDKKYGRESKSRDSLKSQNGLMTAEGEIRRIMESVCQNSHELSDILDNCDDYGSETTNDLLEEAEKSATTAPMFAGELDDFRAQSSLSTGKLQRLLAESREMVHNLEKSALKPLSTSTFSRVNNEYQMY